MKTIKLPYKTEKDSTSVLKQYSNVVRCNKNITEKYNLIYHFMI
jgi:hypothetical protein